MEYVPCENQDICPEANTRRGCFEDIHHLYFPRSAYRTPTQKRFRQLDENKVKMCRNLHNEEHAITSPPEIPEMDFMKSALTRAKEIRKMTSFE